MTNKKQGIWSRLVSAGVFPETSPRAAGFIRASNATAILVGIWLLLLVGATLPYFYNSAPGLVAANLVAVLLIMSSPLWKRSRRYTASDVILALSCLAVVTCNALHFGRESWNHLFLLAAILIGFTYLSSKALAAVNTLLGLGLFVFVELWFGLGNQSMLGSAVPAEVLELFRVGSIYNLVILTTGLAISGRRINLKTQDALEKEQARSEALLRNILPGSIADRLKEGPRVIAERFENVSILFADLVGFTPLSRTMPPEEIVGMLNQVFTGFDRKAQELGLEKIKTIGDAYMLASGVPDPRPDNAAACLEMAAAMLEHMKEVRRAWPGLELRIGVHSGPVVAGVIGESKFSYDIWGETVNLASRMESHGVPGRIHASDDFVAALGGSGNFEERGVVEVKGHGPVRTWFAKL